MLLELTSGSIAGKSTRVRLRVFLEVSIRLKLGSCP